MKMNTPRTELMLELVRAERRNQLRLKEAGRFQYTPSDPQLTNGQRLAMLTEEVGEVARNVLARDLLTTDGDPTAEGLVEELAQVAAIAVAWMDHLTTY